MNLGIYLASGEFNFLALFVYCLIKNIISISILYYFCLI